MFTPLILRRISMVVLVTFTSLTMQPLQALAAQGGAGAGQATNKGTAKRSKQQSTPDNTKPFTPLTPLTLRPLHGADTSEKKKPAAIAAGQVSAPLSKAERYGKGLDGMRELLERAEAKESRGERDDAEIKQLRSTKPELEAMETEVVGDFTATEQHLKNHKLPPAILARQQAALKEFRAKQSELKQKIKAIEDADDANDKAQRKLKVKELSAFLKATQHPERHTPVDPNKLQFRTPDSKVRAPIQTEKGFKTSLFKPDPLAVMLAGPIPNGFTLPATTLPATPTAEDLAATEDIVLTPAIKAQAAALNNNPVQIYNWVRNNIEFLPTYGSIQGADMTLQTKRGNSFDTASLLIALLRAAGIPARYVYGTIEVPADQAMKWVGGVNTPEAVLQLMGQGGIPSVGTSAGGMIKSVKLEHVWVNAWVDYVPSRGAVNKVGDTWIPMDASYKVISEMGGLDLQGTVSLNAKGVLDSGKQGAICSADSAQGLNAANVQNAYNGYKTRLAAYLTQQGPNLTVGDVLGTKAIVQRSLAILPGTLPYATVAMGGEFAVLPDTLRWKMNYALYAGALERAQNLSAVSYTASLPSLLGKRLTLSFTPSTPADAATLAAYMPAPHANGTPILPAEFPLDIPAYLIHVKAEIRADGQVVAIGGDFVLGTQLTATTGLFVPATGVWDNSDYDINAGEYQAFAVDGQGIAASQLNALKSTVSSAKTALDAGQYATLSRDGVAGLLLQQAALGYFALADVNNTIFQRASGMVDVRLPSHARAIARVTPQYALGIIVKASFPGVTLSVDRYQHAAAPKRNGTIAAYNRQSMERASAYTHLVLENLFTDAQHAGQGVSAIKALGTATAQNQVIRLVTSSNAGTVVPLLQIDADSKIEIQNAAAAGKQVLAEDGILAVDGWSGSGYIVEDTQLGMGNYRLSGNVSSVLYPMGRMGWLALGSPSQSAASVSYALGNGATFDNLAAVVMGGMDGTRWQYFPAQSEVMNGLFLSNLNALQPAGACDTLVAVIAASFGASSGIGSGTTGTAVNHPPVIQSTPVTNGAAGQAYRDAVAAIDPDGDPLTYSIVTGPTGMTIGTANGVVTWAAPLEGSYNITLRVDDGKAYTDQSYVLVIGKGSLQLDLALTVTPAVVNTGAIVTIGVITMGGQGTVTRSLTVDGAAVALDAAGQARITAGAMGAHAIVATAADTLTTLTQQDVYSVRNAADTTPPTVLITAPIQDAEIAAPVDIVGTASDANLAYYKLVLRPSGAPDTAWVEIGRGYTSVTNGKLGRLDTSVRANGLYEVGLIAIDANGQQSSAVAAVEIYRDLKIGQFRISFLDLDVNAAGIPIRVTRTYDTLRKAQNLDFGYGWSVDYQSLQIRKNMVLGLNWNVVNIFKQMQLCLRPGSKHKISITLPTGKVERFTAANATECAFGQVPPVDVRFTAQLGTTSKLELINIPNVIAQGGELFDMDNLVTWNPTDFKLTTEDGYIYYLKDGVGITQVLDPFGNTLTYGANGILHSNGQSVNFTRDASGRITAITDPQGKAITYAYDANGNLISVTNRIKEVSRYGYNRDHGLTSYTDPSGTVLARYSYDALGRLISVTDAAGKAIQATHDTANNREVVMDRLGRTTSYTYDAAGNVTEILDALGHRTAYTYDALGNETSVIDPLGNITTRTFDSVTGKQLTEADPLGGTTRNAYDNVDKTQLNSSTDKNGNVTSYAYFPRADRITEPLGRVSSIGYDAKGNLSSFDIAGQATANVYDTKGNRTSETDALGNITSYTYDANGRELTRTWQRTNASGVKVSVTTGKTYDAEGRVISETDALGGVTKTTYNTAGKVTSTTDPQGRTTAYTYDAQARLIKTTYPDGTGETVTYDAEGNQIAMTDRAGRTTRMEYDGKNRLTKTVRSDGTADITVYDAAGRTDSTQDANGNPVTNRYDAAGRLVASTDALNQVTSYSYDANGNRTGMTNPAGKITSYTYDALNRLTKTTYPDGTSRSVTYLANGRKSGETDQNGNSVAYGYDAMGRINQVTLTSNGVAAVTGYGYDEVGNKVSQTDANGRITKWAYDNANRVVGRTLPNGETETWQYDQVGNRIAHTDFLGKKTSYTVDANGRTLFTIDANGNTVGYLYTASGQVAGVTDSRGTTKNTYDAKDRLTRQDNPDGTFLAYAYDANGNVIERSAPAGTATYAYDKLNRLISVTGLDGKQTGYTYDANGNRVKTVLANGTETVYSYDALNRLTGIEHRQTASGSILRGYAYALKPNGQRAQVREYDASGTLRTRDYIYDALNRLTQDTLTDTRTPANSKTTAYAYGNTGNRTNKTETQGGVTTTTAYVYDADDRLTSETRTQGTSTTTTSYAWDANGNLTQKTEPAQTSLYTWDSNNRLIEVKRGLSAATATSVATWQYDANGNRVGKTMATGQKIAYLVDSNLPYAQVAEEKVTLGMTTDTTTYLYGIERIQQIRAGQGMYYHPDGLGSTRALTDAAGNLTDAYDYDAYGQLQGQTGVTKNDFLYAGEQFDLEANLYYNRARYLDTSTGRFTGLDPFAGSPTKPVTLNKYAYANGDPINGTDPSGLETLNGLMAGLDINANLSSLMTSIGTRTIVRKAGCLVVEAVAEEALTGMIYVFLDGETGLKYVGKTTQELQERLKQHSKQGLRSVERVLASFKVAGGKDVLQLVEQTFIDAFGGLQDSAGNKNLSNTIEAINKKRGRLKGDLLKLNTCK